MIPKTGKPKDIGLDDIEKELKRLQGRATTLQSKAIVRTNANVEKTGCAVTIIKNNTQNIERMIVEDLRPVINETHRLVREARLGMGSYAKRDWPTDFYAKATRIKDTHASPTGLYLGIDSPGFPSLQRKMAAMGSLFVFGRRGEFVGFDLGKFEEKLMGPIANVILNSLTPKQWEQTDHPGTKVSGLFNGEPWQFLTAAEVEKAAIPYRGTVSWNPRTRRMMMQLNLYSEGESPTHF